MGLEDSEGKTPGNLKGEKDQILPSLEECPEND